MCVCLCVFVCVCLFVCFFVFLLLVWFFTIFFFLKKTHLQAKHIKKQAGCTDEERQSFTKLLASGKKSVERCKKTFCATNVDTLFQSDYRLQRRIPSPIPGRRRLLHLLVVA